MERLVIDPKLTDALSEAEREQLRRERISLAPDGYTLITFYHPQLGLVEAVYRVVQRRASFLGIRSGRIQSCDECRGL